MIELENILVILDTVLLYIIIIAIIIATLAHKGRL